MSKKEKYIEFCRSATAVSIFMQPWYLDLVCGDTWDVVLVEKDQQIIAALPFDVINRYGLKYIQSPKFSPAVGPYIKENPKQKRVTRRSFQRKILSELFDQLPYYDQLKIKLSPDITDWRPLSWMGFDQSTYHSSLIPAGRTVDQVLKESKNSVRSDFKKASAVLDVRPVEDYKACYALIERTLKKKGKTFEFTVDRFCALLSHLHTIDCLHNYGAFDAGQMIGCVVCIEDLETIYYIFGGFDANASQAGSQTVLIIEALKLSRDRNKNFDFEGSMVRSIDRFFMGFDPEVVSYSMISHVRSRFLKIKELVKKF